MKIHDDRFSEKEIIEEESIRSQVFMEKQSGQIQQREESRKVYKTEHI